MRVDHCCRVAAVSKEFLDLVDMTTRLEQVGGKRVPQRMGSHLRCDARLLPGRPQCFVGLRNTERKSKNYEHFCSKILFVKPMIEKLFLIINTRIISGLKLIKLIL